MGRRSDIKPLPSLERLRELLSYDEESGVLTWKRQAASCRSKVGFNSKCAGKIAGSVGAKGYVIVGISKSYYLAHRIIWKMKTGADPVDIIDHRDANRSNNRWANLRQASNGSNIQNSRIRKDNRSGIKGVHWESDRQKWRGVVTISGRSIKIGRFDTLAEAEAATREARERLHGEFARAA